MTNPIGSLNNQVKVLSFKQNEEKEKKAHTGDTILAKENENAPLLTSARITADKFQNAVTVYPIKGLTGSRNANFYEFLTMGMFPYLTGSLTMIGVFNAASKFFSPDAAANANKLGKKMALGVLFYGIAKNVSKKLIELPIKAKYGVDVNLPYKKVVNELPESTNDKDLISNEYHKVFESVDFPRWDLLYNNEHFGNERNSYYDNVAKKMGYGSNLKDSDQIVKPKVKELIVKARTFSTFASYLWAAVGVGIAMQKPWENLGSFKQFVHRDNLLIGRGIENIGTAFGRSVKEFVQGGAAKNKVAGIAGKALLAAAAGVTLIGNIVTLTNPQKAKSDKAAATSIIDENKTKVVC